MAGYDYQLERSRPARWIANHPRWGMLWIALAAIVAGAAFGVPLALVCMRGNEPIAWAMAVCGAVAAGVGGAHGLRRPCESVCGRRRGFSILRLTAPQSMRYKILSFSPLGDPR